MRDDLTPITTSTAIDRPLTMRQAGRVANRVAADNVFRLYLGQECAENTRRRHRSALDLFAAFLRDEAHIEDAPTGGQLLDDPQAWADVTFGLVLAFRQWLLQDGYAVGSVNGRLSTVRTFAKLAHEAGTIAGDEYEKIRGVRGVGRKVDEQRDVTRIGHKAASPIVLGVAQVRQLKRRPDTEQGRRDRLMVTLLVDHGLRVSELVGLSVEAFALPAGVLTFYRQKVDRWQRIEMTTDARAALSSWLDCEASPAAGPLLQAAKVGDISRTGLTTRSVATRIAELGRGIGVQGLSPHDLRHTWATAYVRGGGTLEQLREAGGWSSLAMPLRYIEANETTPAHNGLGY